MFSTDYQLTDNRITPLVSLYVKSKLKPQETTFTSPFKDQVWCKIADLHIGVCYCSTNYSIVGPDNNDNVYQLLHEVSKEHFLLMGDFNFPDVNWHNHAMNEDASSDCTDFFDCDDKRSVLSSRSVQNFV